MAKWLDPAEYSSPVYPGGTGKDPLLPRATPRPKLSFRPKFTTSALDLWVLQSTRTKDGEVVRVLYYMTKQMWTRSPANATLFTDFDAAQTHAHLCHCGRAPKGWADGSIETFDVVPLHAAIMHSMNGKSVTIKKD